MCKKIIEPKEAINTMCHTSERNYYGTIYTISDIRFPEYEGFKIQSKLIKGKYIFSWIKN